MKNFNDYLEMVSKRQQQRNNVYDYLKETIFKIRNETQKMLKKSNNNNVVFEMSIDSQIWQDLNDSGDLCSALENYIQFDETDDIDSNGKFPGKHIFPVIMKEQGKLKIEVSDVIKGEY